MSDPLPAPVFNLMYDARPHDFGARYAVGIEQAGVNGSSRGEAIAADAGAPPCEPHHLLPTPDPIDASVVKAILVPQFLTASLYTSHWNAWRYQAAAYAGR